MRGKKLCSLVLAAVVLATGVPASATSIKSIQNEKAKNVIELSCNFSFDNSGFMVCAQR